MMPRASIPTGRCRKSRKATPARAAGSVQSSSRGARSSPCVSSPSGLAAIPVSPWSARRRASPMRWSNGSPPTAPTVSPSCSPTCPAGSMISSSAWCRNYSGAACSGVNTRARRCAKISACRGRRTDFSEPIRFTTYTRRADDLRRNMDMRGRIRAACLVAWAASTVPAPAAAWDFPGHRIVGAIADLVLQQHQPATQQRVSELLEKNNGSTVQKRSLSEVAVFPDCAKKGNVPFCGRPPSEEEKAYAGRNPHHDKFHFADVPPQQPSYVANSAGTQDIDVVQMIAYAVAQLRGKAPTPKPDVNLTDTEAVWLLAHLVGDIHQPLHVGAKYFNKTCETRVDPNIGGTPPTFGIGDTVAMTMGGNLILLVAPAPAVPPASNLHLYWDSTAVVRAMQAAGSAHSEQEFAKLLAAGRLGNHRRCGHVGGTMGERDHAARGRGASAADDPQGLEALALLLHRGVHLGDHARSGVRGVGQGAGAHPSRQGGLSPCRAVQGDLRAVTGCA